MLLFTACTPNIGMRVGGIVISDDGMAASEVIADSQSGMHGSVTMGSDMKR